MMPPNRARPGMPRARMERKTFGVAVVPGLGVLALLLQVEQ